ncbi:DUF2304 domain-containing protein [Faecalicoccus pleomorphus]|uniref:DUF2304 domain-containing protein n=1 Tax=Faecalicoccus pleomorphus TaxID=1323 RepID=UPI0022E82B1C|nr:DUF2304 domain-containing protein [Faecalicoccus pleomorphus]
MALNLRLAILTIAIILTLVIIKILKKDLIPIKYSLLWWLSIIVLLFLVCFPNVLVFFANLVGFQTISNMVSGILFVILIFITISLTVIVSSQKRKINLLFQEISILKADLNAKKERK